MLSVFVYGTLKPGECNYAAYCAPWVLSATPAWTRGELYALPAGYPALTDGDRRVTGVLFGLNDAATLTELDALEDYAPGRSPAENEYERRRTPIFSPTGEPLGIAWAYWMARARIAAAGGQLLSNGVWSALACDADDAGRPPL